MQVSRSSDPSSRERGFDPVVARATLEGMGRAMIEETEEGAVSVVAYRRSGRILGASMWGPQADEVASELSGRLTARAAA
jgi:pyruvate/2-oxoglutarate dehydrogenase complex dihydrolipoamide dehydrogenase (E3) component